MLEALGLQSWVKTTERRRAHVVAPIRRTRDWAECLRFAKAVAQALAGSASATYTTQFQKQGRSSRILTITFETTGPIRVSRPIQRGRGPAQRCPSPLTWKDLTPRLNPWMFTVSSVPKRLQREQRDPWNDYWVCRQQRCGRAKDRNPTGDDAPTGRCVLEQSPRHPGSVDSVERGSNPAPRI